jgi:ABC exporter DevB family membrane fusion protein
MILVVIGVASLAATGTAVVVGRQPAEKPSVVGGREPGAAERAGDVRVAAAGRVEAASETVEISAEVSGRIVEMLVDEGADVRAGQVLARLDADDYRARVRSAEARVGVAEAERDRLINGARVEDRREAEAQRAHAQATLDQAETEVTRRQGLLRDGVISQEEFERAVRDARLARARLAEATERSQSVSAGARQDDLARALASVALAAAQLDEARALLAKTEIRAPQAGRIIRRHRRAGELVSPERGQALVFEVADLSHLRVRADVDETDVARIAVGQPVFVTAGAFGDKRFTGRVVRIGQSLGSKNVRSDEPTEKKDTKVLETLIDLDPDVKLPLGLRVDVFIGK